MKLTKKQLMKLIKEATYFPPSVSQQDIDHLNFMRPMLSPEQREKADTLVAHDPTDLSGYMLGGAPEDKPDQPMKNFDIENEQDLHSTPLARGGGMKEVVMEVDEEMYDHLTSKGFKSIEGEDEYYSLPLDSVYQEMRKYNIPADLVDEVIKYYSYYGYKLHTVDMGGRKVKFIKVLADQ